MASHNVTGSSKSTVGLGQEDQNVWGKPCETIR
jgi:hypothetical protein